MGFYGSQTYPRRYVFKLSPPFSMSALRLATSTPRERLEGIDMQVVSAGPRLLIFITSGCRQFSCLRSGLWGYREDAIAELGHTGLEGLSRGMGPHQNIPWYIQQLCCMACILEPRFATMLSVVRGPNARRTYP
jgi:hypothetical protein